MPLIQNHPYRPPRPFRSGHVNTIYHALFRKVKDVYYMRERMETPDGDFMDLDYSQLGSDTLVVLVHGLESNADVGYIRGMVRLVNDRGWDALAINLRGCSGEPNRLYSAYHAGKSEDLHMVLEHHFKWHDHARVLLVGYSLGGNLVLKYMGEKGEALLPQIKAAAAVSVPCRLKDASIHLQKPSNRIYLNRFLKSLKAKGYQKKAEFPEAPFTKEDIRKIKSFYMIDTLYTAPAHGFGDAEEYWNTSSCQNFLAGISRPSLLINAIDDPFLPESCHPHEAADASKHFFLHATQYGGHVGFIKLKKGSFARAMWHEQRMMDFFDEILT